MCDLHTLTPFENNFADEVPSVHVVEHFWRWEVVGVLKEWARVLKPGWLMILECPNVKSRARLLFLIQTSTPDKGWRVNDQCRYSMGTPAWRDSLMVHRWNYTPQSLAAVMAEAGLANIRQEPAQFELREPRDMRIMAEKPLCDAPRHRTSWKISL